MPRLSYRSEAIPFAARPSARSLRLLLAPGRSGELPFRSVGPEPEMRSTTGLRVEDDGSSSVPWRTPDVVVSVTGDSGCCVTGEGGWASAVLVLATTIGRRTRDATRRIGRDMLRA